MIRNIVFDMGQVLTGFDPNEIIRVFFDHEADIPLIRKEIFESSLWQDLDRGTLTEQDLIPIVKERLPQRFHSGAEQLLLHWREHMIQLHAVPQLAIELKKAGYPLYLLSNAGKSMFEFKEKLPVLREFSGILFSAEVLLLKPDPKIYQAFFERFSLKPEECFFIDDMSANIEAGRSLGMEGFRYTGEIEPLRAALRCAGVNI